MLQIGPQKAFPIVWVNSWATNTSTLYVQAVVRNALTNATLKTVNLTDQNGDSSVFSASYTAPQDPSQTGTGLYIIITVTVYDDSGYTNASSNYAVVTDQYLVKTLVNPLSFLGGGGGVINEKAIEAVVAGVVKATESKKTIFGREKKFPTKKILKHIDKRIDGLPTPVTQEVINNQLIDINSISKGISSVLGAIKAKPVTKQADLRGVTSDIKTLQSAVLKLEKAIERVEKRELKMLMAPEVREAVNKKEAFLGMLKQKYGIS
jgi:uncharacterized protein YlxW (UPF0749 family)|tara:strand:- start:18263 stop:19054 length:792 start_codon:yes stop_codon:yes gene_type:complete